MALFAQKKCQFTSLFVVETLDVVVIVMLLQLTEKKMKVMLVGMSFHQAITTESIGN